MIISALVILALVLGFPYFLLTTDAVGTYGVGPHVVVTLFWYGVVLAGATYIQVEEMDTQSDG